MGTVTLLTNPKRRTAKRATRKPVAAARKVARKAKTARKYPRPTKARASMAARVLRRRRKNPSARGIVDANLMPALKGAVGAVAINTVYDMLPIPANLQVGMVGNLVKMGAAIGIGMAAEKAKLAKGTTARDMVNGMLTVQLAGMLSEVVGGVTATLPTPTPAATGYVSAAPTAGALGMYEQGGFESTLGMYDYAAPGQY